MADPTPRRWPVLKEYRGDQLRCIAMPLGGIGTGTVSLGGRGNLRDWEVGNRPAKGSNAGQAMFALRTQTAGGEVATRVLEGALLPPYEGSHGVTSAYHGCPRFRDCTFAVAYPLAQVSLSDPDVPLAVRLEAFNPLIPADAEASGLPVAVLRYVLSNPNDQPVDATLCGTLRNYLGEGSDGPPPTAGENTFRDDGALRGLGMSNGTIDPCAEAYGELALATTAQSVTYLTVWSAASWAAGLLAFWDDLSNDGRLTEQAAQPEAAPHGSLAAEVTVPPHGEASVVFLLAWRFPNRPTWTPSVEGACACGTGTVGNYYATRFASAWEAARYTADHLPELERRTARFVSAFCGSDLPAPIKEAALFNLSTLRSQTAFRIADGTFLGWEGCSDCAGCCYGSCTHVWNYESATAHLYGDLARSMREVEFLRATDDRGHMSFRVNLPLETALDYGLAAADGQMGCIVKAYRDWRLSGDDAWLARIWPAVKRALAFAWGPGGWDADQDGVMEGCQHNTLDVEYYGPNPLMAGWYLAALRAGEALAAHMGDVAFSSTCRDLYQRGRAWIDAHLFNGEYYQQIVQPPASADAIADGLRSKMGADTLVDPDFQVGPGCLVDQLVGQLLAHTCDLGHVLDPDHVRHALASIVRYNWRDGLQSHFNPMRTFALNDEQALLMCSFPRGGRPKRPVPYYAEVMTGFEYAAAAHMLYEGLIDEGLDCIAAIRARYDGARRNPFDEAECGHHYARAMASWAAVLAWSGFSYSAVTRRMRFADRPGQHFWSTGYAWGTCGVSGKGQALAIRFEVIEGELTLETLEIAGRGEAPVSLGRPLRAGDVVTVLVE